MTGDIQKSIEALLKNSEYAEAEKQLNEFIEQHPEDREAKMLFGTCRMLQGDAETAKRIHDELEPHFSADLDLPEANRTFWQKYHNWIIYGSAAALVIAAAGYAALGVWAKSAIQSLGYKYAAPQLSYSMSQAEAREISSHKYGGPLQQYYCKVCGMKTHHSWEFDNRWQKKMKQGVIPCKNCGKDTAYEERDPAFVSPRTPPKDWSAGKNNTETW